MEYANGLIWSVSDINHNFKLKVYGIDQNGNRINKLLGVLGMVQLLGKDMFNKLLKRAIKGMYAADKIVCKLRRGLKITFYCV